LAPPIRARDQAGQRPSLWRWTPVGVNPTAHRNRENEKLGGRADLTTDRTEHEHQLAGNEEQGCSTETGDQAEKSSAGTEILQGQKQAAKRIRDWQEPTTEENLHSENKNSSGSKRLLREKLRSCDIKSTEAKMNSTNRITSEIRSPFFFLYLIEKNQILALSLI
jgi:hypothetical protein